MINFLMFLFLLLLSAGSVSGVAFECTYGGKGSDIGRSVRQTSDGGYIVAGHTKSEREYLDFIAVKTDSLGNPSWVQNYGGDTTDMCFSVDCTPDGGYILAGTTNSISVGSYDIFIVKANADGTEEWRKRYGRWSHDEAYYVECTRDGGFIVTGGYHSFDLFVLKLDVSGDSVWMYKKGGIPQWDAGNCVHQLPDEGYIVTGYTATTGAGGADVWLIRLDERGIPKWLKTFGDVRNDEGRWVEQTSDNGFIVVGYTTSETDDRDMYIIKTDSIGDTVWTKVYGGNKNEEAFCVRPTFDGCYAVLGYTESFGAGGTDLWFLKLNASGDTIFSRNYGGRQGGEVGYCFEQTQDSGYIICGSTGSYGEGILDIYLLKVDEEGTFAVEEVGSRSIDYKLDVFPNPAIKKALVRINSSTGCFMSIKLYDVVGRELTTLFSGEVLGTKELFITRAAGVYFLRIESDLGAYVRKLTFLR